MNTPAKLTRALSYLQAIGYRVQPTAPGFWRVESPDGRESWLFSDQQIILFAMTLPTP